VLTIPNSGEGIGYMTLRLATYDDIPQIVEMLKAFQIEAGCYSEIEPCDTSLTSSVKTMIDGAESDIVVYQMDGIVAGMTSIVAYPSWFNFAQKTGQEMFWYIRPEYRSKFGIAAKMFRWLEEWAKEHKLRTLSVASTASLNVDRLAEFYKKRGYQPWDILYTKKME
jgi:N-acetylglutamate synthase-like GNAT family acetyltransferase